MATRTGTNKVLLKLKKSVEAGDYYEAHQMYRTVCNRQAKQYERAIELLSSGATLLLEHKQYSSGVDLSHYLLDVYQQTSTPVNKDTLGLVVALIGKVPSTVKARKQLIAAAIQWTAKHGHAPNGHMELHDYVGHLYRQEGNYAEAEKHFFLGSDRSAAAWGDMLYEGSMGASDITRGNYIARPVLQYLCEKNLSGAQAALTAFMARLKAEDAAATATMTIDIFRPPLVNFCQALVLLVQRDARDLFTMLRNRYRAELREEKVFDEMLDNIGHIYFNIPLPASGNQQMNMMQQMLQGILAGNMGARS
ncbi:hypothetical protein SYNPS1DRAFT_14561 [Syncephalis pseudoplumigaleata]|uniref:DUF410-domain-containing protein n=1 Tax=Syncephalis pseudoplumigaleata TaxID=1712513 RepID=A0A4P9Z1I4_9FUNG|nr:hypothetical protein SYNPS1DRAFT_14561 [Syncephalis pseudoplumigaleata]|eukprot:RKP26175.1 hypothetical protein SYNPS1DRAFT_14561 [Syncephalis pseudoplumigaleata]